MKDSDFLRYLPQLYSISNFKVWTQKISDKVQMYMIWDILKSTETKSENKTELLSFLQQSQIVRSLLFYSISSVILKELDDWQ